MTVVRQFDDESVQQARPRLSPRYGREVWRLRLLFLLPLAVSTCVILAALSYSIYAQEQESLEQGIMRIRASAEDFYQESIQYDAQALQAVMDSLLENAALHEALAHKDRRGLLKLTSPLFEKFRKNFSITHFYFTGPDRVNLLRVHAPERYGDRINRMTTMLAEQGDRSAAGVEMGPLGTFTLRLVSPWHDRQTKQRIGYVELGMEIDRVLEKLNHFFALDSYLLIRKDQLDRQRWENGMQALGRNQRWDDLPTVVQGGEMLRALPVPIREHLHQQALGEERQIVPVKYDGAFYRIAVLPLYDMQGRHIAYLAMLADVSRETYAALKAVYIGSLTAVAVGALLLCFFYWQVGRVGRRIECDEQTLEELATHDGLTGLYNHRSFHSMLENELARGQRHQQPCCLLMIDIDHFKKVNDVHGHQAGDAVLRELSQRLQQQVRNIDRVCRYGGEEIAVILPLCDSAMLMAERLRKAVEGSGFAISDRESIKITVSIGLAQFPQDATDSRTLVNAADQALYKAKDTGRNRVCQAGH